MTATRPKSCKCFVKPDLKVTLSLRNENIKLSEQHVVLLQNKTQKDISIYCNKFLKKYKFLPLCLKKGQF